MVNNKLLSFFIFLFCSLALIKSLRLSQQSNFDQNKTIEKVNKQFNTHDYYNVQQTRRVQQSRSIIQLNECKSRCLQMHKTYPFEFKYHRLIYRQQQGNLKYFIGQCLYAFLNTQKLSQNTTKIEQTSQIEQTQKWFNWPDLKKFLDMQTIQNEQNKVQTNTWSHYSNDCENPQLKLDEKTRIQMKFTLVHSDFEYREGQQFSNLQPFDDINQLYNNLKSPV